MAGAAVGRIRSVPWRVRDALLVFLLPWILIPIAAVILLQLLAPSAPAIAGYVDQLRSGDPNASFGLVALDAVGSFTLIGYYLHKYQVGLPALGIRWFSILKVILYLLVIILAFGVLVSAAYYFVQVLDPSFNPDQEQVNEYTQTPSRLSLLVLVILPPLVEEPVFRGFMFPAFAKRYGLFIGAVITSILFGFAHLQLNVSVYTFILSLLLCLLYTRTGSIIPGIIFHMLNNYVAYLANVQR